MASAETRERRAGGRHQWVWGYDEISWFAAQDQQYRSDWLNYAWNWIRTNDSCGYLEMPGSRMISTGPTGERGWYFANDPGPAVPQGKGDEESIRAIWLADGAQSDGAQFDGSP